MGGGGGQRSQRGVLLFVSLLYIFDFIFGDHIMSAQKYIRVCINNLNSNEWLIDQGRTSHPIKKYTRYLVLYRNMTQDKKKIRADRTDFSS